MTLGMLRECCLCLEWNTPDLVADNIQLNILLHFRYFRNTSKIGTPNYNKATGNAQTI
jgi:hypothetical protein